MVEKKLASRSPFLMESEKVASDGESGEVRPVGDPSCAGVPTLWTFREQSRMK